MSQARVADGQVVSLAFKLSNGDGVVIEESAENDPLVYIHGMDQLIPALEAAIAGMAVGEKRTVELAPEQAYGHRQGPGPQRVPRAAFPADARVEPGAQFIAESPEGAAIPVWVLAVEDDRVVIDFDHPLAGETLRFDITVLDVRPATPEELAHKHVHAH